MKKLLPILAVIALIAGCGGGSNTKYSDPAKDTGSREFGPKEIKITVNKMVESMYTSLKTDWQKPAFLQVKRFLNRTSEHIDTTIVSNEIQTNLIKRRIRFVDDTLTEDAIKEMEKGMSGLIDPDSAIPMGQLKSPNLYLTGDISDNVRTVGKKQIQYLIVTLKLVNLKTGIVEWQDQQEFLKTSSKTKISI
jgi:uncharacterized protein (TIGR02722 family)